MFLNFFSLNLFMVVLTQSMILLLYNGSSENEYPWNTLFGMILISAVIILIQYPLLKIKNNWFYRTFIFYLSMILFLFFYGVQENLTNLNNLIFLKLVENASKMTVIGQIACLPFFPGIVLVNWILRKKTLDNQV